MKTLHLSVPSKTFLLGEYVVLEGGPSLILTTEPRFQLTVNKSNDDDTLFSIDPNSPAGKLLTRDFDFYRHYSLHFNDPYKSLGGFGASSALFLLLKAMKSHIESTPLNDDDLLEDYIELAWDRVSIAPSGADLIAQKHGGFCYYHKSTKETKTFSWPFSELGYCLIHTGNKIATHTHLNQLSQVDTQELRETVLKALNEVELHHSLEFMESISHYGNTMNKLGLVCNNTVEMIAQLLCCPYTLTAKGCGALAADVIVLFYDKNNQNALIEWLQEYNYHVIKYGLEVSPGLKVVH